MYDHNSSPKACIKPTNRQTTTLAHFLHKQTHDVGSLSTQTNKQRRSSTNKHTTTLSQILHKQTTKTNKQTRTLAHFLQCLWLVASGGRERGRSVLTTARRLALELGRFVCDPLADWSRRLDSYRLGLPFRLLLLLLDGLCLSSLKEGREMTEGGRLHVGA